MAGILPIEITEEVKQSFINYAMSVITDRALPDVRDGLKPVQRRILYAMLQEGLRPERPHSKSAAVVGEVIKKYHPHGDAAVYDAMVRLAQPWNMRYPLVDGQGNFGSIDGDPPAAHRYTEAKLTPLAMELLTDIDQQTVNMVPNFDGSADEPSVLPAGFPNLLVNGTSGIAVGMATSLPPHNLGEVIEALLQLIDHPNLSFEEVMRMVPGPDFPTGGRVNQAGITKAYATGRGSLQVRAIVHLEEEGTRPAIVVTEIPYQVNKASLIAQIARLVKEKRVEDITGLRDESDRQGMRIVIEYKKGARPQTILNQLYKHSKLQDTFTVQLLAIVHGEPKVLPFPELMRYYLEHRREVVTRRSNYQLRKAQERAHILAGLFIALDHLDEVIALIRASADPAQARSGLMARFGLTEVQAQAILDMRLQRLTGLERERLAAEFAELQATIERLTLILSRPDELARVIKTELTAIKERFADPRRTAVTIFPEDFDPEDLIVDDPMVITMSAQGFIKRTPLLAYRSQGRGGSGAQAGKNKGEDESARVLVAQMHDDLLFFTKDGHVYLQKVYDLPEASRQARGVQVSSLLATPQEASVTSLLSVRGFQDGYLIFASKKGQIKKTALAEYQHLRGNGLIATGLTEGDELLSVCHSREDHDILLATKHGQVIRFASAAVRPTGRVAQGVRGITLRPGDEVVALITVNPDANGDLLTVTAAGYGKRTPLDEYPLKGRAGQGVIGVKPGPKGELRGLFWVEDGEELILLSRKGQAIRIPAHEISRYGRTAGGVRLMNLAEDDEVVSAFVVRQQV